MVEKEEEEEEVKKHTKRAIYTTCNNESIFASTLFDSHALESTEMVIVNCVLHAHTFCNFFLNNKNSSLYRMPFDKHTKFRFKIYSN